MPTPFGLSPLANSSPVVAVDQTAGAFLLVGGTKAKRRNPLYQSTDELNNNKAAFLGRLVNTKPYTVLNGGECINKLKLVPFGPKDYPPALGPAVDTQRHYRQQRPSSATLEFPSDFRANTPIQPTLTGLTINVG